MALNRQWVSRIFERLRLIYLDKFAKAFDGVPVESVADLWGEALDGYSADEIKRGLDACLSRDWPPTLPEFLKLCRPPMPPFVALQHAIEQIRNRRNSQPEKWLSPKYYWAAVELGEDLFSDWKIIRERWEYALASAKTDAIPPAPKAIEQEDRRQPMPSGYLEALGVMFRAEVRHDD